MFWNNRIVIFKKVPIFVSKKKKMEQRDKRYIINVFAKEDYHCFACSPSNPIGLRLRFYEEGAYVKTEWKPEKEYEGYPGAIHGGIQATLLDEVAAWTVYIKARTSGVTSRLNVKYKKTLSSKQTLVKAEAKIIEIKRNLCFIEARLLNEEGEVCTEAEMVYFMFPHEEAVAKGWYPARYEDFFEEKGK